MLAHEFYHGLRESLRAELRERHKPDESGAGGPAQRARTLESEMAAEYYPKPKPK